MYIQVLETCPFVDDHLLRARLYKVGVRAAAASIAAHEVKARPIKSECAVALVSCSIGLLGAQLQYLGKDHPDLISSWSDLFEGLKGIRASFSETIPTIESLLSQLPSIAIEKMSIIEYVRWSKAEMTRLKSLYSTIVRFPQVSAVYNRPGACVWISFSS
jgi:hypothetical protein